MGAPWRRWYKTTRWQRLRDEVFLRDLCTCRRCGRVTSDDARVCDHVEPHRGDERLFWDAANLQTLCKDCHDRLKQSEEQASLHRRGVWH
ncbi:HNH endonuclease [Rhodovulum sp. PH10]|uniref:HNH endonuclease n=1 Tax=Rhodovulum sp. PH10 TaxID=1187851 RepID=UPI00058FEE72|nr:HNH endonuclease [Rhodovulum sp. PH10]